MKKRLPAGALCACLLACAAGCGESAKPVDTTPETTAAAAAFDTTAAPEATEAATEAQKRKLVTEFSEEAVTPYNAFSLELLRRNLNEEGSSTLVSPLSVLSALGMAANGADGETLTEFESAFGLSMQELNLFMAYLRDSQDDGYTTINNANSLWLSSNRGFQVKPEFLDTNAKYYNAQVQTVPFSDSLPAQVNGWVKENTHGMIDNILDKAEENDVAYLVNAVAFEAKWLDPYDEYDVKKERFTREDGTAALMDLMSSTEDATRCYLHDDNAEGFLKPYSGNKYAFAALLPDKGVRVKDYLDSLSGEKLTGILKNAAEERIDVKIPKFESTFGTSLVDSLKSMGIKRAFDMDDADLSRLGTMMTGENLYLSEVIHKTYISVAEQGTKAGAATIASATAGSAMPSEKPKQIYLDRPFVYMLVNLETNTPLFIGTYMGE